MVLKKPYGLMIKHFKLIHVLLLVLSIYVLWQVRPLVSFFNDYVAAGYTATIMENMAGNYINSFIYVSILVIIALLIMLVTLLHYKKKPTNIYIISLVYYIILLLGIIIAASLLNSLEEELWSTTAARMYRDISLMVSLPQYIFLPFWLIRALGFNIKQFNFQGDLAELNLSQVDSEEVEINFGFETYKARRTFHRFIREFKYYYSENKFLMIIILVITIALLTYLFFSNFKSYVSKYNMQQAFAFSNLSIKVEDSIITNLNYGGDKLNDYYLLLKLTVANNTDKDVDFEYNKFLIYSNNSYYEPNISESSKFIDYGESFLGSKIKAQRSNTIILPYKIKASEIQDDYYLGIYFGTNVSKKKVNLKTIRVDLSPVVIDNVALVKELKINEAVSLNNTYLNNTTFTVKNILITDRYIYDYKNCESEDCPTFKGIITPSFSSKESQTLIVMDYDFKIDLDTPYAKMSTSPKNFANNFFKIRYILNGENYTANIKDVTPEKLANKLVLQTNKTISEASKVDLLITIRNKQYVINLVTK